MQHDGFGPVHKKENIRKLVLGTVQLGQKYGIANKTGKPVRAEAERILSYALDAGIDSLDTAPAYGESEYVIGSFIEERRNAGLAIPRIITKIPSVKPLNQEACVELYDYLKNSIKSSMQRLRLEEIDVCLLHDTADMTSLEGRVVADLLRIKEEGLVKKIGVSVYTPEEAQRVLELACFDIIEAPVNILDHRLIKTRLLNRLAQNKIEVYARSVFLQGLLFLEPGNLPAGLKAAKAPLEKLKRMSLETGLKPHQLSLLFVRDLAGIERIVIGCETPEQLIDNFSIIELPPLDNDIRAEIGSCFYDINESIINPTLWPRRIF